MRIMVAMSGGVDSSVAAMLLKSQGHDICGGTLIMHKQTDKQNAKDAAAVCKTLGIPHYVFDCTSEFNEKVVERFVEVYKQGGTPNPCIFCNMFVKFPEMLSKARELGYTHIATGHYANIECDEKSNRYTITRPKDRAKDQTYVLYGLSQELLSHTLFPLWNVENKQELRKKAIDAGLVNANKPDSQDICFVPDGDYAAFIKVYTGIEEKRCKYVDQSGKFLGDCEGISSYTIGQRKGLKIALGKPCYVIEKRAETGEIVLGDEEYLFSKTATVCDCNFLPFEELCEPMKVTAKTRYSQKEDQATITPMGKGCVKVEFEKPQRAITPGQSAVFYLDDKLIGGGVIKGV